MSPKTKAKPVRLGEILIEEELITAEQLETALKIQKESGKRLGEIVVEKKWITEAVLVNLLSGQMKVPHVSLRKGLVDPKVIPLLPKEKAELFTAIPMFKVKKMLTVAIADPRAIIVLDELEKLTGCQVQSVLCRSQEIEKAIEEYYGEAQDDIPDYIGTLEEADIQVAELQSEHDLQQVEGMAEGNPIIQLVNHILLKAIKDHVSDIHIEPGRAKFRVRYRIDGVLYEALKQKMDLHPAVVSRLKIMSGLDISERRLPQDGRVQVTAEGRMVDLRFSSMPGIFGEKVVLRILDKGQMALDLNLLGLEESLLVRLKDLLKRPHGLIIVTGPTGSGKTTTLYGGVNFLNSVEKNIVTIEDPVEYQIEGINQNQVKEAIGLDFPRILKHTLRQDPDVIMVGEIRDRETAEIAIKAAMTGHLVLSTLHTNDSAGAVSRLRDMGIESYLIASSLSGVIAQRLVRTLCTECKTLYYPPKSLLEKFSWPEDLRLARGKGCPACYDSGYKGRCGLYEYFELDAGVKAFILSDPSVEEIQRKQKEKGVLSLFQVGLKKVREGLTTLEELSRAISAEG